MQGTWPVTYHCLQFLSKVSEFLFAPNYILLIESSLPTVAQGGKDKMEDKQCCSCSRRPLICCRVRPYLVALVVEAVRMVRLPCLVRLPLRLVFFDG